MPKPTVFPYGITLQEGGRIDLFPAAEVWFPHTGDGWFSLFLVIDSGASISALPRSDAVAFGIEAEGGIPLTVSGIGGAPVSGWKHDLSIRLGTQNLLIPIVFLDHPLAPRVLGRKGIFDRFLVLFDEKERQSGFIGTKTKEARTARKILGT